jgi:Pyruvate/2-oxoacid:ferredoxin oxidoreductase delta subunit
MVSRNIVKIDEEKCNGCGLCVIACAEGAIKLIGGKAKLISESYCDGLGACIGHCPQDAISIEQRESAPFDEQATKSHPAQEQIDDRKTDFVCPSSVAKQLRQKSTGSEQVVAETLSRLSHWPVQLRLVSPNAPHFAQADLLLVADCVPFAMGDFHSRILKGRSIAVGCPKFTDAVFYIEKLSAILKANRLKSLTVVHMEVPCCFGLTRIAREAIASSGVNISFDDVTVDLRGNISKVETIEVRA